MSEEQTTALTPVHIGGSLPMEVQDVMEHVQQIERLMRAVMKHDEHFGTIPGCPKPSLLQPGAQKIGLMFRLQPRYQVEREDLPNEHREYEVICELYHADGTYVGMGVGNCSTMETKYRYRSENTGRPVPREYWDSRDKLLLGGPNYTASKKDGEWVICERVDHDNPADYYNTVKKMATKRAYVHAIIQATAASDIFTQDIEDMAANGEDFGGSAPAKKKAPAKPERRSSKPGACTEAQRRMLWAVAKANNVSEQEYRDFVEQQYGVTSSEEIPFSAVDEIKAWLEGANNASDI